MEQELLSNTLFKKLQKTLQEKTELENQLSRSLSTRGSPSSTHTGLSVPDSPFMSPSPQRTSLTSKISLLSFPQDSPLSPGKSPLNSYRSSRSNSLKTDVLI